MKRLLIIAIGFLASGMASAQDICGTVQQTRLEEERDPYYAQNMRSLDSLAAAFDRHEVGMTDRDGFKEITIPVVVHILYRDEALNISNAQVHSQIEVLNREFRFEHPDRGKIPEVWKDLGQDAKIRFQLADRDPEGNFTNGITRTLTDVENIGSEDVYHLPHRGGVAPWNRAFYMNIWVCELKGNTLGFALLPGAQMSDRDGIVISFEAFGTMGTARAPYNKGRTMVHEVGHYLGLRHPWGSDDDVSCGDTDYIDDTPAQKKENFGCQTFPSITCGNGPNGDMFMNFMDYSNDTCSLLFTKRQIEFMQLVLKTNRRAMFYSDGVTGITEHEADQMKVFPNPSAGRVSVILTDRSHDVVVVDMIGKEVHRQSATAQQTDLELSHLPSGVYTIHSGALRQKLILD